MKTKKELMEEIRNACLNDCSAGYRKLTFEKMQLEMLIDIRDNLKAINDALEGISWNTKGPGKGK